MKRSLDRLIVGIGFAGLVVGGTAPAASAVDTATAMKTCKKGGFAAVVQSDGTAFRNVGACVSYVAQGGVLVPMTVITVKVEFFQYSGGVCVVNFSFTGKPNTQYTIMTRFVDGLIDRTDPSPAVTDAAGRYSQTRFYGKNSNQIAYTVNGVTTGLRPLTC